MVVLSSWEAFQGFWGFSALDFEPEGMQSVPLMLTLCLSSLQAFPVNLENRPAGSLLASQVSGLRKQADGPLLPGQGSYSNNGPRSQGSVLVTHPAPLQDANLPPEAVPAWPAGHGDSHVIRFTRTVNSLPNGNPVSSAELMLLVSLRACTMCWALGGTAESVSLQKPVFKKKKKKK